MLFPAIWARNYVKGISLRQKANRKTLEGDGVSLAYMLYLSKTTTNRAGMLGSPLHYFTLTQDCYTCL